MLDQSSSGQSGQSTDRLGNGERSELGSQPGSGLGSQPGSTPDEASGGARRKLYTVRPVVKPLSQGDAAGSDGGGSGDAGTAGAKPGSRPDASREAGGRSGASGDPFLRAATEDDDGYDPYSDRREEPPLFEPSPWG